jgi:hypothetical protein
VRAISSGEPLAGAGITIFGEKLKVATPPVVDTAISFAVPTTEVIPAPPTKPIVAYGLAMLPLMVIPFAPIALRTSAPLSELWICRDR